MATSRLVTALRSGQLILPEGPVRVMRPPLDMDLSALPDAEVQHGSFPALEAWKSRGLRSASEMPVPSVLVCVPRSKTLARQMVLHALIQAKDLVIVDGQKVDGVDSLWKACRDWADIDGMVTKGHGRLFWFAPDARPDWHVEHKDVEGFTTRPGVFSEDKVDRGSRLLAEALPPLHDRVADFGAGWGYLSDAILRSDKITHLDMVEAEAAAIACLAENITDPRAKAHWDDATTWTPEAPLDAVVMNPPFHEGRKGVPALGQAFIENAACNLSPRGALWLVANRHLPYEECLGRLFRQVSEVAGDGGFKVIEARGPRSKPGRTAERNGRTGHKP